MMLYVSFPAWSQNDKAHAIKQQHPTSHCHDGCSGAAMHILYEWHNQLLWVGVCVSVCAAG